MQDTGNKISNDYITPCEIGGINYPSITHAVISFLLTNDDLKDHLKISNTIVDVEAVVRNFPFFLKETEQLELDNLIRPLIKEKFKDPIFINALSKSRDNLEVSSVMDKHIKGYHEVTTSIIKEIKLDLFGK